MYILLVFTLLHFANGQNKYGDHGIVMTALPASGEYKQILSLPVTPQELTSYEGTPFGFNDVTLFGQPFACDVDYDRNQLYVYDHTSHSLMLLDNWNSSASREAIIVTTQHYGISKEFVRIAVDWVSHNVYWTDPLMNWIAMQPGGAINDPTLYKVVVQKDLILPRAVAVDPLAGRLFWSDFRSEGSRIESSDLIGGNRRRLVVQGLLEPLSIVTDVTEKRIYWVDGHSIDSSNYDGGDRRHLLSDTRSRFFDVTLFKDIVIATDIYNYINPNSNTNNYLRFYDKHTGQEAVSPFSSTSEAPVSVCMYHADTQLGGQDLCLSSGCSDICVEQDGKATCVCRDGYDLQPDNTCKESSRQHHRAIVISTGDQLCLLDIRILSDHHDYAPTCFYQLPVGESGPIEILDLNMMLRHVYFAVDNFLYRVAVDGEITQLRYQILEANFNITGLSYDYVEDLVYYTIDSTPPQIWTVDPTNVQHSTIVAHVMTGKDPHNIVVVPHEKKAFWISNGDTMEYMDITGGITSETKQVTLDFPMDNPKRLLHDIKYNELFALVVGFQGDGHKGLMSVRYNGTLTNYLEADIHIEDFAVYGEYILLVHEINGSHVFKSADLGLGYPLQEVASGSITGIDRVYAMRVLDLDTLQPKTGSQCGLTTNNGGCEQICISSITGTQPSCQCYVGYQQQQDGSCKSVPVDDNFLLVTDYTYNQIFQIPLEQPDTVAAIPISDLGRPDGVMYNYMSGDILWSSFQQYDIWAVRLDGTRERQFGFLTDSDLYFYRPDRMALDHSTGNIIFTAVSDWADDIYDSIIGAINKEGTIAILVWNGHLPRDIVLDSAEGYMFWTDSGSIAPGVFKAKMDGSSVQELIQDNVVWPNGLALDHKAQRIYWTDGFLGRIYSCDYYGNNRVLVKQSSGRTHLMDITLVGDYLYFTDLNKRQILKMRKDGTGDISLVGPQGLGNLQAMHVFQREEIRNMPKNTACSTDNGGCSDFCFPMPGNERACGCDWWWDLLADGKTCENAPLCPPTVGNGYIQESATCVRGRNQSCNFRCGNGYRPRSSVQMVTCQHNEDQPSEPNWDVMEPCEEIRCPDYVDNGLVNSSCTLAPGSVCAYHCNTGYQPAHASHILCREDGVWNHTVRNVSICVAKYKDTGSPVASASVGNKTVAIGVGVAVAVLILVLVLIGVLLLLVRMGKLTSPFKQKETKTVTTTEFENPRYENSAGSVDLQAVGTETNRSFNYATLDEDTVDLTNDSWRKTQQQAAAHATNNVYDNNVPKNSIA